jgi:biopolymer transport protein ExbD
MSTAFTLPRRRRRITPYLDLTAMIDTVFNLLIFFAVASTFVGARSGLDMRLPTAETTQRVSDRIIVTLLPGQPAQVNGASVAPERIGEALKRASGGDADAQIVVMADRDVPYSQLVTALDQARLADYHRIALAAAPRLRSGWGEAERSRSPAPKPSGRPRER